MADRLRLGVAEHALDRPGAGPGRTARMPPIGASMLANVAANASLTLTVPHRICRATARPRVPSRAVDGGVQAVLAVVGAGDRVGLVGEPVQRDDRPERLVAEAGHVGRDALEDGRLVEVGPEVGTRPAAGRAPGAPLATRVLDVRGDGVELGLARSASPCRCPSRGRAAAASP